MKLEVYSELCGQYEKNGYSYFHYAALGNNSELLEQLYNCGFDLDDRVKSDSGETALYLSIDSESFSCFDKLIALGAKIDIRFKTGRTALYELLVSYRNAAMQGQIALKQQKAQQINRLLLGKPNLNLRFEKERLKDYFTLAFSNQIDNKTLDDNDAQIIRSFFDNGFIPQVHVCTGNKTVDDYINNCEYPKLFSIINPNIHFQGSKRIGDKCLTIFRYDKTGNSASENEVVNTVLLQNILELLVVDDPAPVKQAKNRRPAKISAPFFNPLPSVDTGRAKAEKKAELLQEVAGYVENVVMTLLRLSGSHMPKWLSQIKENKLQKMDMATLELVYSRVRHWAEKLARRSQSQQDINSETATVASEANEKQDFSEVLYESCLHFNATYMRRIENSENAYLLAPVNGEGEIDLAVIAGYQEATDNEVEAFKRILDKPRLAGAKGQPGIKFIRDSNYKCAIEIDAIQDTRTIVAEFKITGTQGRIALYLLRREGYGPTLLALGPFVKHGFHDKKGKTSFKAHAIDVDVMNRGRTMNPSI